MEEAGFIQLKIYVRSKGPISKKKNGPVCIK